MSDCVNATAPANTDASPSAAGERASVDWPFRWTAGQIGMAAAVVAVAAAACALAGWAPLGFSIVTVFLFAGPHNWFEGRYFLTQMPARWGRLATYFLTGIGGVLALTAAFVALPVLDRRLGWREEEWLTALAAWNSSLVLWVAVLASMRSRTNPRRNWPWLWPIALLVVGLAWLWPRHWDLSLVYLHPLLALWFLDRELRRRRPGWRGAYHAGLVFASAMLAVLYWRLAAAPDLPGEDALASRIARHAGAGLLRGVSSHFLVAAHTYLEMLHYGAWVLAMPLVAVRSAPWKLGNVPLARRSPSWRMAVAALLVFGAAAALALWAGFLANYPLTRDVYFTVAMLHVLAEAPFLLRLL